MQTGGFPYLPIDIEKLYTLRCSQYFIVYKRSVEMSAEQILVWIVIGG
jgi:hypothetical protein